MRKLIKNWWIRAISIVTIAAIVVVSLVGLSFRVSVGTEKGLVSISLNYALAADTGGKYPATVSTTQETGDDNDWTTASDVGADDGAYGQITAATFDANDVSYLLRATNFSMGVTAGATIDGIVVEIERYYANGQVIDVDVNLTKNGTARVGSDYSTGANFVASPGSTVTFGGATDKWGTTWTAAEVNTSTFGVFYKMGASAANADGFVDFIRVTVYFTSNDPVITVSPTSYDFGVVTESSTPSTSTTYFTIDNTSSMQTDQTISVTTSTWSGGVTWTHDDTATPGTNTAGMLANKGGTWGTGDVIVKNASPNFIAENQAANTDYSFGLKLIAPTVFTDGVQKTIVVRVTASSG